MDENKPLSAEELAEQYLDNSMFNSSNSTWRKNRVQSFVDGYNYAQQETRALQEDLELWKGNWKVLSNRHIELKTISKKMAKILSILGNGRQITFNEMNEAVEQYNKLKSE